MEEDFTHAYLLQFCDPGKCQVATNKGYPANKDYDGFVPYKGG